MSPGLASQCQGWDRQPSSSSSTPMHVALAINRRSWKPLHSRTATTWSPSLKCGGTTHMTGMLSWMATDSLGKTGQQGEVVKLLCMWGSNCVLVLAAAGNKSAMRPPLPPPACEGEWKETGRNWWVGIRAV